MKKFVYLFAVLCFSSCFPLPNNNGNNMSGSQMESSSFSEIKRALNKEGAVYIGSQTMQMDASEFVEGLFEDFKSMFGDRQVLVPIEASFVFTVYFSEITDLSIDGKTATLTLPPPHFELESWNILWDKAAENVGMLRAKYSIREKETIARNALYVVADAAYRSKSNQNEVNHIAEEKITELFNAFGYDVVVNYNLQKPIID